MMEFFISKFWAFLVSIVIMGVLVQGMQIDSRSDRDEALMDMAKDLETMFKEFAAAGKGMETTMYLDRSLPSTVTLTVFAGYASLQDGDREVRFSVPSFTMWMETEQGELLGVDRLVLGQTDSIRMRNEASGTTLIALSR